MLELEKTYLAKYIPDLTTSKSKQIIDVYLPETAKHPKLRLRKNGENYEMTKKYPQTQGDASIQIEQTIKLTKLEFDDLYSQLKGKTISKMRYLYDYQNLIAEIDVFQEKLAGLVLVDFEFASEKEKDMFQIPDFCLKDVTQETFIAGGMLCGNSYQDIEQKLVMLNYRKLLPK